MTMTMMMMEMMMLLMMEAGGWGLTQAYGFTKNGEASRMRQVLAAEGTGFQISREAFHKP